MLQMPLDPDRTIITLSTEMDLQLDSQESFLHWIIAHILKCAHLRDIMVAVMGTEICLQSGDEKQEQVRRI